MSVSSGRNLITATPAVYLAPCLTRVTLAPKLMGTRLRVPSAGCFPLFQPLKSSFVVLKRTQKTKRWALAVKSTDGLETLISTNL